MSEVGICTTHESDWDRYDCTVYTSILARRAGHEDADCDDCLDGRFGDPLRLSLGTQAYPVLR